MALATPTTIPATVEELADQLELLAAAAAEQYGEQIAAAQNRTRATACGEHRHNHIHGSGFLLGVCTALALATGQQSDDVYQRMLGGRIR